MTRLLARPIYGWGWIKPDGATTDVPAPFQVDLDVDCLDLGPVIGVVDAPGHEFDGLTFRISCRHAGSFREDQNYNVALTVGDIAKVDSADRPPTTFGYLMLDPV